MRHFIRKVRSLDVTQKYWWGVGGTSPGSPRGNFAPGLASVLPPTSNTCHSLHYFLFTDSLSPFLKKTAFHLERMNETSCMLLLQNGLIIIIIY